MENWPGWEDLQPIEQDSALKGIVDMTTEILEDEEHPGTCSDESMYHHLGDLFGDVITDEDKNKNLHVYVVNRWRATLLNSEHTRILLNEKANSRKEEQNCD
jgi:hypothetical protein